MPNSNKILGEEFYVSKYLNSKAAPIHEEVESSDQIDLSTVHYGQREVDRAIDWMHSSNMTMIIPTNNMSDLEDQWYKFNSMILKWRRASDWESINIFGLTNQRHYEYLKQSMLKNSQDTDIPEVSASNIDAELDKPVFDLATSIIESVEDPSEEVNYNKISYGAKEIDAAIQWSMDTNKTIIVPTKTLSELEDLWDQYNLMIKKNRRESDWESSELFGVTNLKHYIYLKSKFLKKSPAKLDNSDGDDGSIDIDDVCIGHMPLGDSSARIISSSNMRSTYVPRLISDGSGVEIAQTLMNIGFQNQSFYEQAIAKDFINKSILAYREANTNIDTAIIPSSDMPFMTPEEMIDLGVYSYGNPEANCYGCLPDNYFIGEVSKTDKWFESYQNAFYGAYDKDSYKANDWLKTMNELYSDFTQIKRSGNQNAINARKQSILELGWNPEYDFTSDNRVKAYNRISTLIRENCIKCDFVDLRGMVSSSSKSDILTEKAYGEMLYPVYIVTVEGDTPIVSKAVKAITKSKYSHACISFDASLKNMYGFKVKGAKNHDIAGGFRYESIDAIRPNNNVFVCTIFLKKKDYNRVKENVAYYEKHSSEMTFGYLNFITILFNIPMDRPNKMICSQFVDRVLKLADIDITNKNSSLVKPGDFEYIAHKNGKIYILYDGIKKKYNENKVENVVATLQYEAKPIKESFIWMGEKQRNRTIMLESNDLNCMMAIAEAVKHNPIQNSTMRLIYESFIEPATHTEAFREAKEFPMQFDDKGDLIIRNLKKMDYELEYSKSHKLLKQYAQTKNIEGMKFELAKLWMMNEMLEKKLFGNISQSDKNKCNRARAKILNDFQFYIKEVNKKDKEFNFAEYYDESPFSTASLRVSSGTLKHVGALLTDLIMPDAVIKIPKIGSNI